ncbi:fluoride efflux transporter FluC [Nocardioides alkalitolerans]|uniref:fluoride efflux transporter FluC n=1 Tax=Nocardioides alkalitolerans TaxID=281714 RepID=UPI0003FBD7C0|nr:CrcB family protein [Nocardioides alkalitolerans]
MTAARSSARSSVTSGARPAHLRPGLVALVVLGGTLGTGLRHGLDLALPPVDGVPLTIAAINVAGAFLLGLLLETVARRGPEDDRAQRVRLLLGTGVLGGFTTYSALAVDTALLLDDRPLVGLGYAAGTLVLGLVASVGGVAVAAGRRRTHGGTA